MLSFMQARAAQAWRSDAYRPGRRTVPRLAIPSVPSRDDCAPHRRHRRGAGQLIVDGAVRRANQFGTPGTEKQDTSETHNAAQAEYDRLAALVVPWRGAQIPGVLKTANGMPSLGDTKPEG